MRLCVLIARITMETGSVESACIVCRMDVIVQVYRRFDSSTILRLSTFFHADWLLPLYRECALSRIGLLGSYWESELNGKKSII